MRRSGAIAAERRVFLLAAGAACVAASLAGCATGRRFDPDRVAAAAIGTELSIAGASSGLAAGAGRLWVRLMPLASGEAVEAELEWTAPDGAGRVRFEPGRSGRPAGVAIFDALPPGTYRPSSFLVSGRFERRGGDPLQVSLAGDLDALAPIELAAGDLADLGALALAVSLDGRYEYKAVDEGGAERLRAVVRWEPRLASFRPASRPVAAPAGLAGTAQGVGAGGAAAGAADGGGARAARRAADGDAGAAAAEDTGADGGRGGDGGPRALVPGGARGGTAGSSEGRGARSGAHGGAAGPAGTGAAAALGIAATAGAPLALEATRGSGLLRIEVRPVGGGREARRTTEVAWELEPCGPAGDEAAGAAPGHRPLRLFALAHGTADAPDAIVLPLSLPPGEHELTALAFEGSIEVEGTVQPVAAAADLSRLRAFRVRSGEHVDLGVLAVELLDRRLARAAPGPARDATARVRAAASLETRGLVPVARPIEAERGRE